MATVSWPSGLKTCITEAKQRREVVGFLESPVSSGPSYVELFSDDTPTTWDITFVFNRSQAMAFQAWLRQYEIKTTAPFFDSFPIQIEEGLYEQEFRFTSDGYPQCTGQSGNVFTYTATVLARAISNPYDGLEEYVLELSQISDFRYLWAAETIDLAVNYAATQEYGEYNEFLDNLINVYAPE